MPRPKQFDRDTVLLRAMTLFRDKGYEATSIQDLVDKMGINRFSLYATFGSKHNLFVEALQAYYRRVAIPFFDRLKDPASGLKTIERLLLELVSRIKTGVSPNGCLLCNSIAELGARSDQRTKRVLQAYLKRVEADFRVAVRQSKANGEIRQDVDADRQAKILVAYSTGLLSAAKVLSTSEMRRSVRGTVAAMQ